jgi:ribosomal protein S28E/S33
MGKIVNQDLPSDPPAPSAGNHVIYTKAGGVFVRSPSGVVGPLSAGGTVNNLQDAYDGGASIAVAAGTPVAITGAATGDALTSETSGTGSAIYAETNGLGNGVTVYADPGSAGRGIVSLMEGTGAAVYAEKSNTGNGIEVKMISPAAGSGLRVDSLTAGATSPGVDIAHAGEAVGVLATMTNAGNATGFSTVVGAAGGFSRGVSVAFSNASASGTGMSVEFSGATATGTGLDISNAAGVNSFLAQKISMASGSTGSGIELTHNGTGIGIGIAHTGVGTASTRGLKVLAPNAGSVFYGAEIDVTSTKSPLLLIQRGTGNLLEAQKAAVPVFTVDGDGNTTTPSVTFNGGGTVTILGDTGVAGDPINPRVELTSGPTNVGSVARVHKGSVKVGAASVDVETAVGGQFSDFRNEQPTFVDWQNSGAAGQVVYLPSATRYPVGTELILWCVPSGASIVVTDFGVADQRIKDTTGASATQNMIAGSARRFLSIGPSGWILSGSF